MNFIVPVFNCKCGKDRTGHFDLETKFLASRIKATGHFPKPGELSDEERETFSVAALKSGNLTMQRYNTGLGGYKTFNQTMLLNRMPRGCWIGTMAAASWRLLTQTSWRQCRKPERSKKISMLFLQAELSPASLSR